MLSIEQRSIKKVQYNEINRVYEIDNMGEELRLDSELHITIELSDGLWKNDFAVVFFLFTTKIAINKTQ